MFFNTFVQYNVTALTSIIDEIFMRLKRKMFANKKGPVLEFRRKNVKQFCPKTRREIERPIKWVGDDGGMNEFYFNLDHPR